MILNKFENIRCVYNLKGMVGYTGEISVNVISVFESSLYENTVTFNHQVYSSQVKDLLARDGSGVFNFIRNSLVHFRFNLKVKTLSGSGKLKFGLRNKFGGLSDLPLLPSYSISDAVSANVQFDGVLYVPKDNQLVFYTDVITDFLYFVTDSYSEIFINVLKTFK